MAEPVTVIYSLNMASGEKKFDPSGDDFEFQGVYQLGPDTGIVFVEKSKVSKMATQPSGAELTEVKDMKLVAAIACRMGWSTQAAGYSADKVAVLKEYGYDLIRDYTDQAGIEAKALEYLEA